MAFPPPGPHGGDVMAVARALGVDPEAMMDLSATMNPFAPDVAALVRACSSHVRHYPDAHGARRMLADTLGVDHERVLLTNGGAEAISLVASELKVAEVIEPEFSLWRHHLEQVCSGAGRVRSNPNNPTGLLAASTDRATAWDEAFYPLTTGTWTRGDADHGSIVVGSLTKVFACPGLRIGYVIGHDEESLHKIARRQPVWSVGSLSLAVLEGLLSMADIAKWAQQLQVLRTQVAELFRHHGFHVEDGDAPWVLVHSARCLREPLARCGVLVRDCASFSLHDVIRVSVPRPDGIEALAKALDKAVASIS